MLLRSAAHLGRLCCTRAPEALLSPASVALRALVDNNDANGRASGTERPIQQHRFGLLGTLHMQTSNFSTTGGSSLDDLTGQLLDPEALNTILQANRAVEAASIVAAKTDAYVPTEFFINLLDFVHAETLWPWWVAIAVTNVAIRAASLPLSVFTQRQGAKMQVVNEAMTKLKDLQAQAARATDHVEYQRLTARVSKDQAEMMAKHGKTLKMTVLLPLGALLNGAIFVSLFSAINRLTTEKVPSLTHGGSMWFMDLTVPDPYFGIPIFCAIVTLASVEMGALGSEMGVNSNPEMMERMKWFMRLIALAFIPAGYVVPAGVGILWVSNSVFGIVQSTAFRMKPVRAALGLPPTKVTAGSVMGGAALPAGGAAAGSTGLAGLLGERAKPAAEVLQAPPPKPKLLQKRPKMRG